MAFERNDIVNKTRLMGELGEELMGFEHNDIVTVDVMNNAIEEGGGGGGTGTMWHVVVNSVAVEGNYLNVNKAEDTDDYGTFYVALPAINDVPYSSISVAMDDGIENLTIGYMVADVASDVHPIITIAYDASIAVNATGDIAVTHDEYDFSCTITGDGTITITEA